MNPTKTSELGNMREGIFLEDESNMQNELEKQPCANSRNLQSLYHEIIYMR